jgi:hypothetical protein
VTSNKRLRHGLRSVPSIPDGTGNKTHGISHRKIASRGQATIQTSSPDASRLGGVMVTSDAPLLCAVSQTAQASLWALARLWWTAQDEMHFLCDPINKTTHMSCIGARDCLWQWTNRKAVEGWTGRDDAAFDLGSRVRLRQLLSLSEEAETVRRSTVCRRLSGRFSGSS